MTDHYCEYRIMAYDNGKKVFDRVVRAREEDEDTLELANTDDIADAPEGEYRWEWERVN